MPVNVSEFLAQTFEDLEGSELAQALVVYVTKTGEIGWRGSTGAVTNMLGMLEYAKQCIIHERIAK
jgi:hypothetical protein